MVRQLLWIFLILEALSGVSSDCRSGLEPIGSFVSVVEKQMDQVLMVSNAVCKSCADCPHACFRDLLSALKEDIDELRKEEEKIIEIYLNSNCPFEDITVVVGPSSGPIQIYRPTGVTELPISNVWGVDIDTEHNILAFNKMLEIFKTDMTGTSTTRLDFFEPPHFVTRPKLYDAKTIFYPTFMGDLYRYHDGTIQKIISMAPDGIFNIALDRLEGFVYWTSPMGNHHLVKRATLSGENMETALEDARGIITVALDSSTKKLYYTTMNPPVLAQFNLLTGTASDIVALDQQPVDMSVCVNRIFMSYGGDARFEARDRSGVVLDNTDVDGRHDFVGISACNRY